jgi:hypothetical protein
MTLREIVSSLIDSQDASIHSFRRLYNMGVFGMKTEFNLDVKGKLKTVLLSVSPNKTAEFPSDYISYSKIGVVNGKGEIACFKRNNQLTNYHQEYYSQNSRTKGVPYLPGYGTVDGLNGGGYFDYNGFAYLNYNYSGTNYNLFGIGSGTASIGEYKVDDAARVILFGQHFYYDEVLLEYLSDGSDEENDDYYVDVRMAEAVKSYLRWQNAIDMPKKYSPSQIQGYKSNYYNQKRLSKMRMNPLVLNELQDAERRSWKLTAKA